LHEAHLPRFRFGLFSPRGPFFGPFFTNLKFSTPPPLFFFSLARRDRFPFSPDSLSFFPARVLFRGSPDERDCFSPVLIPFFSLNHQGFFLRSWEQGPLFPQRFSLPEDRRAPFLLPARCSQISLPLCTSFGGRFFARRPFPPLFSTSFFSSARERRLVLYLGSGLTRPNFPFSGPFFLPRGESSFRTLPSLKGVFLFCLWDKNFCSLVLLEYRPPVFSTFSENSLVKGG